MGKGTWKIVPFFLWSLSIVVLASRSGGRGPGSATGAKQGSGLRDRCPQTASGGVWSKALRCCGFLSPQSKCGPSSTAGGVIRGLPSSVPAAGGVGRAGGWGPRAFIPWEEDEEAAVAAAGSAGRTPCSPQGCPLPGHLPVPPPAPCLTSGPRGPAAPRGPGKPCKPV